MFDGVQSTAWRGVDRSAADLAVLMRLLEAVLASPEDEIQRAAAIRAFELACESCWALVDASLRTEGVGVSRPEAALRAAVRAEILPGAARWRDYRAACQLLARTDSDATASYVYALITDSFVDDGHALLAVLAHPALGASTSR